MFKRIIQTGVNLTRIGIDTVAKVVSNSTETPPPQKPITSAAEAPPNTSISGLKANLLRQANFKHEKILLESVQRRTTARKQRIPDLKFTAVGSNKTIELRKLPKPAVLFISHRENAEQAAALNWELIKPYDRSLPIFTANIILLNEFPAITHPMVKRQLNKAYHDIIKDYVKDASLAEQIVHLLPDWKAASVDSFHLAQRRPILVAVVMTQYGEIQRVIESVDPLPLIRQELGL